MSEAKRVLFLCTGNSARSQMAEALLRHVGGSRFPAFSAGTEPRSTVHPRALETLRRNHIPVDDLVPKNVSKFAGQSFDYVITLCDNAREHCPAVPGAESIHWSFPDPAEETDDAKQSQAFQNVFLGLERRIRLFVTATSK
jgi:protein-tyrosine-phosphatase